MDLYFSHSDSTEDERSAVDAILGPADSRWMGGHHSTDLDMRTAATGHTLRAKRHHLLPVLHGIQSRLGWISPGALSYACRRLNVPPAEAYGVASFYALLSTQPRPPTVVHVCDDIACLTRDADEICHTLEATLGPAGTPGGDGQTTWLRSPCLGQCERAPAALLSSAGLHPWEKVLTETTATTIMSKLSSPNGQPTDEPDCFLPSVSAPQAGQSGLRLLKRIGTANPTSLNDYRANDGYKALEKAFEIGSHQVIQEITHSKLVGRGGAAFPASIKWKAVSEAEGPCYLICNADESEPGTFKDRVIMEGDPFALIEAMTIAGIATGCECGFIYIRGEYPLAIRRLENAIEQTRQAKLLGKDVMGQGVCFDIEIRKGAGAYICGEETALFNSIEGYRGEPRNKPPFPTEAGLFQRPTLVNNVETLVNVPHIILEGGATHASIGTERSTGPKLFCVAGHVKQPGVYEVEFGVTLREIIELSGGVAGNGNLQAVLLGGAAGAFVTADELDIPLTFEGTRATGATLGSGVVMLFDDTVDMRQILLRIGRFFRDESCGQCVPCRVGTVRQEELLHRLNTGKTLGSPKEELVILGELGQVMRDASICGLGHTASSAIESALKRWDVFGSGKQNP